MKGSDRTLRIAMWSGPRNISTAMMRSWENRSDTSVVDEPFYAYYLVTTGMEHPCYKEIIENQPNDWQAVAENMSEKPVEEAVFYQKQMTHHMLPEIELDWCKKLVHCFLIRDPIYVVNSYVKKNELLTVEDIGIKRQFELYRKIVDVTGQTIPIIDSRDFLANPKAFLEKLCEIFGINFNNDMLSWPEGARESDGVWAEHWYDGVNKSTGFRPFVEQDIELDTHAKDIAEACRADYLLMWEQRLMVVSDQ